MPLRNGIYFLLLDILLFSCTTAIPTIVVALYTVWRVHITPLFLESMYRVSIVYPEIILIALTANYVSLVFFTTSGGFIYIRYQRGCHQFRRSRDSAMFFFLGLCCIVFTGICIYLCLHCIDTVRSTAEDNFKKAMTQYDFNATSRYYLNNFHIEFRCCGINGVNDWLSIRDEGAENTTEIGCEAKFPPTCCDIIREPRIKFGIGGCREALMGYLDNIQIQLLCVSTLVMVWVLMLLTLSLLLGSVSAKAVPPCRRSESRIKIKCKNAIFVRRTPSRERHIRTRVATRSDSSAVTASGTNVAVERHAIRLPSSNAAAEDAAPSSDSNTERSVSHSKSHIIVIKESASSNP